MTDGNKHAINQHLAEVEAYEAKKKRDLKKNGPWCEECGEPDEDLNESGFCEICAEGYK